MTGGEGSKLKLMVVDDEPDNLDLLYRTFRRDFQVYKAESGPSALELLDREGEMAIVISDQRMPQMNGTEFLGRTVDRFPDTIRILLTGYTDVEDLVDAINSGQVFKYITKPWNPAELKAVVQQAAETYKVLKRRTDELHRALQRETLFNAVTSAIRESLDYRSMLQRIVETIGQTFKATECRLRPVEGDRLLEEAFSYQVDDAKPNGNGENSDSLLEKALKSRQTQIKTSSDNGSYSVELIVPLICKQELLAVLCLYQESTKATWSPEDITLIEGVAEQAALAVSQAKLYQRTQVQAEQMRAELEVARQIQHNLLRQELPEVEGVRIQACCFPAREVGGDFFEVYAHPKGDIWLAVGDVSGKGVPAALFMASAISVMRRELSQENPPEPNVVMQSLNSGLSEDLIGNNCFITMVLARYTPATGQLVYANAGHIYPLVWSYQTKASHTGDVEPNFLKARGVPLGILPNWKGAAGSLDLKPGEALLLASDGITEATITSEMATSVGIGDSQSSANLMLKQEGLWALLKQENSPLDLTRLLARIRGNNQVQEDDQTILSLEVL
ncbi:SpoIIE family protein phosphatase [Microseira wollei]|uniref:Response regulator receiver modulated serine phosphatase with GAF sensor n=1 Tax=Microseira wollei NIES-4236 TaxID=2530354 RepID=A0AAV3XL58_9CYAN|nr:SpoIIE family protein phosphatase [Microseira wollei]GET40885.1 response regulator receiver modulated serine phosphatase with GAF sensor [Microseira wollei NIES-4236]